jgi:hypothetical protein
MLTRKRASALVLTTCALLLHACSEAADGSAPGDEWFEVDPGGTPIPTYEEYRAAAATSTGIGRGFLVETDMFFPREEELRAYYDRLFLDPVDKSVINTVGGVWDVRATPMNIRYCFSAGWGQNQGTYTAPPLDGVRTAIQQAMAAWQAVARVRFTYMSNLDGASCNNSGANPGVDFVVQHWSNPGTAIGPFPSNPWSDQRLLVPTSGISRLLAIHEIGHSLGFRHEHIHTGATPRCAENNNFAELTEFDTLSCMKYSNCTAGNFINGTEISPLDGVGVRKAYGPPDWWWAVLPSTLM